MRKMRKIELVSALFLLISAWGIFNLRSNLVPAQTGGAELASGAVLYYGSTCPHCKVVDEFIEEHNIKTKISFEEKEVYENRANAEEMMKRARESCGLQSDTLGVPFMWTGEKCLVGDKDIVAFLKNAAEGK